MTQTTCPIQLGRSLAGNPYRGYHRPKWISQATNHTRTQRTTITKAHLQIIELEMYNVRRSCGRFAHRVVHVEGRHVKIFDADFQETASVESKGGERYETAVVLLQKKKKKKRSSKGAGEDVPAALPAVRAITHVYG